MKEAEYDNNKYIYYTSNDKQFTVMRLYLPAVKVNECINRLLIMMRFTNGCILEYK